ncbi:MAG: hypothetical protein H6832_10445 [Planctomycetes bacterium]|nr:hypothetical protein [Planctomycetota bacterium]
METRSNRRSLEISLLIIAAFFGWLLLFRGNRTSHAPVALTLDGARPPGMVNGKSRIPIAEDANGDARAVRAATELPSDRQWRFVTRDARPIAGALVRAWDDRDAWISDTARILTTSDAHGIARLPGALATPVATSAPTASQRKIIEHTTLVATCDGFASTRLPPATGDRVVDVVLEPTLPLHVKCVDFDGRGIEGCSVVVAFTTLYSPPLIEHDVQGAQRIAHSIWGARSGTDGIATIRGLPRGPVRVHVHAPFWSALDMRYRGHEEVTVPCGTLRVVCAPVFAAIAVLPEDVGAEGCTVFAAKRSSRFHQSDHAEATLRASHPNAVIVSTAVGTYGTRLDSDVGTVQCRVVARNGVTYEGELALRPANAVEPERLTPTERPEVRRVRLHYPEAFARTETTLYLDRFAVPHAKVVVVPVGSYEVRSMPGVMSVPSKSATPEVVEVVAGDEVQDIHLKIPECALVRVVCEHRLRDLREPHAVTIQQRYGSVSCSPRRDGEPGWTLLCPAGPTTLVLRSYEAEVSRKELELEAGRAYEWRVADVR